MITMQDIQSYLMWPGLCLFSGVALYGFFSGIRSELRKQSAPKAPDLAQEFTAARRDWASEAKEPVVAEAKEEAASAVPEAVPMSLSQAIDEVTKEMLDGIKAGKLPEMIEEGRKIGEQMANGQQFAQRLKRAIDESPDAKLLAGIARADARAQRGRNELYLPQSYDQMMQVSVFQIHAIERFRGAEDAEADPNCICCICAMRRDEPQAVMVRNTLSMYATDRTENVEPGSLLEGMPDLQYPSVPVWMHRGRVLMSDSWPPQKN